MKSRQDNHDTFEWLKKFFSQEKQRLISEEFKQEFIEEKNPWWYSALLPFYIVVTIAYIIWRSEVTLISIVLWYSIPLFIIEIYNAVTNVAHLFVTRKIIHPVWNTPLTGKTVDIFIPTYNEPEEIVEMTCLGAMQIKGIRNVYILDDGHREGIARLAKTLGVQYAARGVNTHAKAGNMNFGLSLSDAQFVIFVDSDHIPVSQFIIRTLGYFRDPKLAFVQTPQVFYNISSFQFRKLQHNTLWNEQTMFYEAIQPAKNIHNSAFFCGSGAILRRAALDSVGGFATGTATEDIHTSLRLHAKGWNSLFVDEKLAFGLAPEDLKEYHDQRVRWGAGSLGLMFRTQDSPLVKKGLTFMQRLCYFNSTNAYLYGGIIKLFYFSLPVILLLSLPFQNSFQIIYTFQYMVVFIPFLILSYFVTYIYSRRTFHILFTEQFNIANIFSCLAALKGIIKVQKKFKVSIKSKLLKENHIAYYFIFGMLALMLAVDLFGIMYWFVVLKKTMKEFLSSQAFISLFWNTYNAILVFSLFEYINAYNRKTHTPYPFLTHKNHPVFLDDFPGKLQSISLKGAHILLDNTPAVENVVLQFSTSQQTITIPATITSTYKTAGGKIITDVSFNALSVIDKKALISFFVDELVTEMFEVKKLSILNPSTQSLALQVTS